MSVATVPELLRRGAMAPAHVSAVDAVMGEDWAHLELGRGSSVRPPADEGRRTGSRRRAAVGGVLSPNPQALVKLIGTGGTASSRGLKAQMDYLSRQGDVPLRSSESTFGAELGPADAEQLPAAWGLPDTDRGGADRTSHFVVSFPQGTNPEAAERAGRAWAVALFDSGAYGDRWDYYTAFHKDTAYPHIHVVVGRRGSTRAAGCGCRRGASSLRPAARGAGRGRGPGGDRADRHDAAVARGARAAGARCRVPAGPRRGPRGGAARAFRGVGDCHRRRNPRVRP